MTDAAEMRSDPATRLRCERGGQAGPVLRDRDEGGPDGVVFAVTSNAEIQVAIQREDLQLRLGPVSAQRTLAFEDTDPLRFRRELRRARSLPFVATTRARDSVVIIRHGRKGRFLP